ncbi:hypothetical protein B0H15DRAFT_940036 [Mycena belliarum]|uniref:Transglutaminase-like domain-containing protein n=1 Tax=Mycena belliarum TaxID=1033014 RepID=A0AAD6XPN7_9AGAR|nr:hypothetical protein B0H15DRAFT_940036 [Mycena belliae]
MSARPALPPRRRVPPPPPPAHAPVPVEAPTPTGIAARIASLQLDQTVRAPPPPPRRNVARKERDPELLKALARRPPPPPCHDFAHIDAHAAGFPRHTIRSIPQLASDLTAPFASQTEKARAIFYWLHCNITYDVDAFFSGNLRPATAASTLQSGLAVCDGYAGMFAELAECAGLQAHKVTGHGKGFGYQALDPDTPVPAQSSNHAWNCVLLDGEWRLLDACWGAGALMGQAYTQRFAPVWFTSTPAEFGRRHFPTDSSYQLIPPEDGGPVSWEDYILAPEEPTVYGDFHTLQFLQDLLQPATHTLQSGQWVSFQLFKQCEHISRAEADNYVYFINTPDDTKTPLEVNEQGGWSADIYMPRGTSGDVSLNYVTKIDGRDAKGLSAQAFKNSIGRKSMAWGGMCKWTLI